MNFISISDIKDITSLFKRAEQFKKESKRGVQHRYLEGKTLAMIFEKASTRTRVSFEVAMTQLGGHPIYMERRVMQLERGETIKDTAKTLSRYVDGIMIRAYKHETVVEMANHSTVPVINGLTDLEHPCQVLSDLFTIREVRDFNIKLAYVGDGNNVCNSLILGSSMVGMDISVGCPIGYEPNKEILKKAEKTADKTGAKITITHDPIKAVSGADIIYTDVWISMGQEEERERRLRDFRKFQVNSELVKHGNDPLIMHCLPANRGEEITDEVIDSENSIVFQQAENRLHVQKALLYQLLK